MYSPLTIADVRQSARKVLARPDAPTAVITNSDYTAHAVYKAARELGRQVGPEVSVIGHDDLATSELLDPPLATIWLDRREMGRALMRRLLGQVPADDYVAPVELIDRASLRAPALRPVGRSAAR
jgi:LacI family transcriptional regulator